MFWENLTVDEFASAIKKSDGVCVFPIGCLEKHGNHLPLGTDIFIAREIAKRACLKEDFIIFPFYPLGMVAEVKHKMGTVALSSQLQFEILHGICDEIYRNGIDKIIIGNGHGGNNMFLNYFAQAMLEKRQPYVVYIVNLWELTEKQNNYLIEKYGEVGEYGHGDVYETSNILAIDKNLAKMNKINLNECHSLHRSDDFSNSGIFTGINWYANYPHQFAGDPSNASADYGNKILDFNAENLVENIKQIKKNSLKDLFEEFYNKADNPEGF